ncbi:hypothetical protein VNI00_015931 [Paramarasmius palmivorus]|uniref:Nucleoplasmin-like domain-containing protein n=1 Tax=Paramarasmius palmivorus TaxID=297713 RepID=A0AAW0BI04_9AGAR
MLWSTNVAPGNGVKVVTEHRLRLSNAAIATVADPFQQTQLTLFESGKPEHKVVLCTLGMVGMSSHSMEIVLDKNVEYTLRAEGANTISVIGWYNGTTALVCWKTWWLTGYNITEGARAEPGPGPVPGTGNGPNYNNTGSNGPSGGGNGGTGRTGGAGGKPGGTPFTFRAPRPGTNTLPGHGEPTTPGGRQGETTRRRQGDYSGAHPEGGQAGEDRKKKRRAREREPEQDDENEEEPKPKRRRGYKGSDDDEAGPSGL